jgi:ketosteroid isomerase-like protein
MSNQENADVVRRGYEAFIAGDMGTLGSLFADDAVWHVGGSGGLAGDKQGKEAIMAYFGELYSRSGGTMKVELQDVIAGERHTVGLQTSQAQRNGKSMAQQGAIVFDLKDGKVTEVNEFLEDTAQASDFWS